MTDTSRVAVLIDCDNISAKQAKAILAETARHGTLSVKRGYGDWASPQLAGWKAELSKHAIQPIQQFAYVTGKNATDTALIIDAMDLLYSDNVDLFYIVSSDSDFTRLAMRLRESGRRVFGIGAKKTPEAFTNACDRFTFVEVLGGRPLVGELADQPGTPEPADRDDSTPPAHDTTPEPEQPLPDLHDIVVSAIRASAKDDGWAPLASVGWYIVNNTPSFDSRNYGYPKLGTLVRDLAFVEVKEVPDSGGFTQLWVQLREEHR